MGEERSLFIDTPSAVAVFSAGPMCPVKEDDEAVSIALNELFT